ncbi:MAG: oxidoreductase C-terminal domain-containing protein, partial [Deltaproteobacteria bacterium]
DQIQALKSGYTVKLKNGESISGDLVVAGIGAVPEVALAEAASLDIENGISVNVFLQTSDPDIYAVGDCCSFPHPLYEQQRMRLEMWRCARDQAECAVQNLLGETQEFSAVPWFWSDQFELSLQVVGLPSFAKRVIPRTRPDGVTIYFGLNDQEQLVSAAGIGTGNSVAKDIRLAEMLIAAQKTMNPAELSDPNLNLKKLLKS